LCPAHTIAQALTDNLSVGNRPLGVDLKPKSARLAKPLGCCDLDDVKL